MPSSYQAAARLATRLAFLVGGFALSCWAPLVPYAKQRLGIGDEYLGALLLCLGLGAAVAMLFTGVVSARLGSKPIIVVGGLGLAGVLPLLTLATTPWALGCALLLFGAFLGSLDVAMNIHGLEVERALGRPLMSGLHALFSIGGFAGAALITLLLSTGFTPLASVLICAPWLAITTIVAWPRLLPARPQEAGSAFAMPRGIVLLLAGLAAIAFLVEGAILDWSALLLINTGLTSAAQGGIGYMLFSVAMTAGRLGGDALVARIGDRATLLFGGSVAVIGFVLLLAVSVQAVALAGFILIGLGAANIVPVLFRRAGSQTEMPAHLAVAAVTATGYAGVLIAPAAIGFISNAAGLVTAFWLLAALLLLVPLCARPATAANRH